MTKPGKSSESMPMEHMRPESTPMAHGRPDRVPDVPIDAPGDEEVEAVAADLIRRYADALDRLGR